MFFLLEIGQIILNNISKDRENVSLQSHIFRSFLKNIKFIYEGQSLKNNTKQSENYSPFFQYFCDKTVSKIFGPTIVSHGFDRAEKTAQDTSDKLFKKYAHSILGNGPTLHRTF